MFMIGAIPAFLASVVRFPDMFKYDLRRSLFPSEDFPMSKVDLVGPLPSSKRFSYLFTCIDRSTRWPEAIPLSGISAELRHVSQMNIKIWCPCNYY